MEYSENPEPLRDECTLPYKDSSINENVKGNVTEEEDQEEIPYEEREVIPEEEITWEETEDAEISNQRSSKRGVGRPKIIRTGKPGRPRKQYQEAEVSMQEEYETLMQNRTWKLVTRPKNEKVLSNKWVYKIKRNHDGSINKYKARLVAGGHQQKYGLDYEKVFAPVSESMYENRILLAHK